MNLLVRISADSWQDAGLLSHQHVSEPSRQTTMTPDEVLQFWFAGNPSAYREVWFEKNLDFDAACARFANALRDSKAGALDHWTGTPHGMLALITLFEQFSRNLHRGSPEAFAADTQARTIARTAIAKGFDHMLGPIERIFVYLPFGHSGASWIKMSPCVCLKRCAGH
jgi:uncharacterized protein (DUF924 family)